MNDIIYLILNDGTSLTPIAGPINDEQVKNAIAQAISGNYKFENGAYTLHLLRIISTGGIMMQDFSGAYMEQLIAESYEYFSPV